MKLALYQGPSPAGQVEAAFGRIARMLSAASTAGADLLLMPELFLPGYNQPAGHKALAQPLDGEWMVRLAALALGAGCGLCIGWAEAHEDAVFNAATVFGPDGAVLAHYRKIQLYGAMERTSFRPGMERPAVFDLAGRRIGVLICYDIEFPQHSADLARRGADLILVPTANPAGFDHVAEVLVPARAHEGRQIIAYANLCGTEDGVSYGGGSVIAGPDARPIARAGRGETLLICDLPPILAWDKGLLSAQDTDYRAL
jgi:predicted amidohydrolase